MLFNFSKRAIEASKYLGDTLRLMVGIHSYENYLNHIKKIHPDKEPMTYEEFFKKCQNSRYGANGNVKCC
ncbi:conserved hypothetical protein of the DUF466 family [Candidatus Kinetoplastibacterium oncopeltii TCC290E]|uniref:YbdD/YjiX family protein n=1 Tax=Candidatus Kinetoplastidibacterium stringomonadis TCC290E TaxID=1208920 RepID=M1LYY1_9PROT|nr:YbdD/YjiX family protein [Candidatus Kinetoplastibacterium oncopeltii]AGF48344.1 conserved hypothetical protein of the DUF466 family [Candidatus Kinetoplastibacterium oncopeltii TCC290E]